MSEKDDVQDMLERIELHGELNAWESNFIGSIKRQYEEKGKLSPRQLEILERIYHERT